MADEKQQGKLVSHLADEVMSAMDIDFV